MKNIVLSHMIHCAENLVTLLAQVETAIEIKTVNLFLLLLDVH